MKSLRETVPFDGEQRAFHRLLLQSKFLKDVGLFDGQMGIVVALAQCYRATSRDIYREFMEDLLDKLMERVGEDLACGLGSGLSGIGWGLEFLLQNGFVAGDSLEVCAELDGRLMRQDVRRMDDRSLATGLEGMLHYALAHIQGAGGRLPFDGRYRADLLEAALRVQAETDNEALRGLCGQYVGFCEGGRPVDYRFDLKQVAAFPEDGLGWKQASLGLQGGVAAFLLHQVGAI